MISQKRQINWLLNNAKSTEYSAMPNQLIIQKCKINWLLNNAKSTDYSTMPNQLSIQQWQTNWPFRKAKSTDYSTMPNQLITQQWKINWFQICKINWLFANAKSNDYLEMQNQLYVLHVEHLRMTSGHLMRNWTACFMAQTRHSHGRTEKNKWTSVRTTAVSLELRDKLSVMCMWPASSRHLTLHVDWLVVLHCNWKRVSPTTNIGP
jgi:hypothetical protein